MCAYRRLWLRLALAGMVTICGEIATAQITQLPESYLAGGRVIGLRSRVETHPGYAAERSARVATDTSHHGLEEVAGQTPAGGVVVDLQGRFGSTLLLEGDLNGPARARCVGPVPAVLGKR